MISPLALGYLLTSFLGVVMAGFVLGRHEKSPTRDAFLFQLVFGFIWQMGTFFVLTAPNVEAATLYSRVAYIGCIFLSVASYQLVVSFLGLQTHRIFVKTGYVIGSIVFIPMITTNLLMDQANLYSWGYWFNAGLLHPMFLLFFATYGVLTFVNLIVHLRKSQDRVEKNKIRLMLWGYVVCYFSVIDFLPDYGYPVLPLGFLFLNLWLFIIWYIIKFYDFFSMWRRIVR